jgi:hypothetical protein
MSRYRIYVCDPLPVPQHFRLSGDRQESGTDRLLLSKDGGADTDALGLSGDQRYDNG